MAGKDSREKMVKKEMRLHVFPPIHPVMSNSDGPSLARTAERILQLAHTLKLVPSLLLLPYWKAELHVSISCHSDSISWDLLPPAPPPRVISTFSSSSGVRVAYRDCANPNKPGWKFWMSFPLSGLLLA